ncbi:protein AF-10-like isoform X5 [Haliotis asinina]|uniref:protein AF-10-like isoform X5 n=1 Tax=Haliotis asinina TaxID=109174 RepID=UPI0035326505
MKEMVGGCCVCSDERGWAENPLVYCDGHGCNVAVHQACYGIVQVPTGPWYCRKCESQERQARVRGDICFQRCELCPQKDGALKRTDTQGWCHVVCALFIPEAWFANVQTMEPIVLKNVPPERFNKTCYICEEQGRETKSTTGSCMTCNKNGCKQNFHVTCAQAQGLLCEEAGNYGDNVKYCGYCSYHYKKLKKDANIKTIPAFKPIPSENATPDTTPEKIAPVKPDKEKARKIFTIFCEQSKERNKTALDHTTVQSQSSGSSDVVKQRPQATPPSHNNSAMSDSSSMMSPEFAGFTEADLKNHPANSQSVESNSKPEMAGSSLSNSSCSPPGHDQKLIMDARFTVTDSNCLFSTASSPFTNASPASSSGTGEVTSPQNQGSFSNSFEKFLSGSAPNTAEEDSGGKGSDGEQPSGKRSRSRSQEKEKKKVRRGKISSCVGGKGKMNKDTLQTGKAVLTPGAKKLSLRKKSSSSNGLPPGGQGGPNCSSMTGPGQNSFCNSVFGGSPYFQSLSAPGPVSLPRFGQSGFDGRSSSTCESSRGGGDADKDPVNGYLCPPKVFPSLSKCGEGQGGFPTSMEQLLERQWEQGSQFLMEQSQHFDIASLLNCLHQLKTENTRLEEYVKSLTERRNQLLTINARLSLPFNTVNNNSSMSHSPPDSPPDIKSQVAQSPVDHSSSQSPAPPIINPITPSNSDDAPSPCECVSPLVAGSGVTVKTIPDRSQLGPQVPSTSQDQKPQPGFSIGQSSPSSVSMATSLPYPLPLQTHGSSHRVIDGKPKDKT